MTTPAQAYEIGAVRAVADHSSRALCLRELRFWRHHATPVDPVADAALAAYQGRLDHLRRLDLAVALTHLQLTDKESRP